MQKPGEFIVLNSRYRGASIANMASQACERERSVGRNKNGRSHAAVFTNSNADYSIFRNENG
jgi:hypothetical protein